MRAPSAAFRWSPGGDRPGRSGRRNEGGQPRARASLGEAVIDALERGAGAQAVDKVVAVFAELVEDDVGRVAVERGAGVVDLLDVALRARRADDVGGLGDPALEPVEALLAHVFRQHRDAAAAEDAGDGDAAPAIVAGRRPDGAVARRVELAGDDPGRKAAVGRQHLVGADHRKPLAEREHDARRYAGQRGGEFDGPGRRDAAPARRVVEPVDAEQVQRMGRVGIDGVEAPGDGLGDGRGVLQLAERRQHDAGLAETRQRSPIDVAIDQTRFQPEPRHAWFPVVLVGASRRAERKRRAGTTWRAHPRDGPVKLFGILAAPVGPVGKSC